MVTNNPQGRYLLNLETGHVRRLSQSEIALLERMQSLPPAHRATMTAMLDVLDARRRKGAAEPQAGNA